MKIKLFSKKPKKVRLEDGLLQKIGNDAYVDWLIVFSTAVILVVVLVSVGVFKYFYLTNADANPPVVNLQKGITGDAKTLTDVISNFDSKAAAHASLLRGYVGPGDPSL